MKQLPIKQGWQHVQALLFYFTILHFAVVGFFVDTLPSDDLVPVPPHLRLYVFGAQLVASFVLYLIDRMVTRRYGDGAQAWLRSAVLSVGLVLILRRLEIHLWPLWFLIDFLRALQPAFVVVFYLLTVILAVCLVMRFRMQLVSLSRYFAVVALLVTSLWFSQELAPDAIYEGYDTAHVSQSDSREPPIIIVVFDGLSYQSLLDESGNIDSSRYPNFARLGRESMAFSNATSNYFHTWLVLPTMIDAAISLVPQRDLVLYEQMVAIERLYAARCGDLYTCRGAGYLAKERQRRISTQLAARSLHDVVPRDLQPAVSKPLALLREFTGTVPPMADAYGFHFHTDMMLDQFLNDVATDDLEGRIYFFHTALPHPPYLYEADGLVDRRETLQFSWAHPQTGPAAERILDAYLEQVEYADTVIGVIVDVLKRRQFYDDATLVVTADHGLRRERPGENESMGVDSLMTGVPLFIRGQGVSFEWTAADYQHIDFGPTLRDLAGVGGRPTESLSHVALEGVQPISALSAVHRERRPKTFFVYEEDGKFSKFIQPLLATSWVLAGSVECTVADRTGVMDGRSAVHAAEHPSCVTNGEQEVTRLGEQHEEH